MVGLAGILAPLDPVNAEMCLLGAGFYGGQLRCGLRIDPPLLPLLI